MIFPGKLGQMMKNIAKSLTNISISMNVLVALMKHQMKTPSNFAKFSLELQFKHPEFLTIIEEKELYPLQEMLGEIGGFLGLMIGASCMSLLELIIYLILSVTRKLQG